jgi:hypothetical protein
MHARRRLSTFLLLALAAAAAGARAAVVEERTALAAAGAFVSSDAVGRTILAGRTVESAEARGRLWIVRLSPAGHVIVAGSDRADPVVGFSKDDFAEPEPGSPAFAFFAANVEAMDALDEDPSAERHPRWDVLLGGGARRGRGAKSADPPAQAVVVEPFLESHWNQWQPYNDYAPVYDATGVGETGYASYRGRDPCGCVATAVAQVMRHFRWPAVSGTAGTFDHKWTDRDANGEDFTVRFDGRAPFDWSSLADEYDHYRSGGYDLRGKVAESVRHPIARLVLWADSLARMKFMAGGSSANYETAAGNLSDWYHPGRDLNASDSLEEAVENLRNGVPCPVGLTGHQVVGHGWASDGASQYIYLNFGWGGSNDGWYAIPGSADGRTILTVRAGHFPRAKPLVDPLPAVTEPSLTLSWHYPDIHTNSFDFSDPADAPAFLVSLRKRDSMPCNVFDGIAPSGGSGTVSGEGASIREDDSLGFDGPSLFLKTSKNGGYTERESVVLSSATVLSFKLRSYYGLGATFRVEARFDGGPWETVSAPFLEQRGDSGWKTVSVYLGDRGGRTMQLRFSNTFQSGSAYPDPYGYVIVDNVELSDVFEFVDDGVFAVPAGERSLSVEGLEPGGVYSATVSSPALSAFSLAPAEVSDPVSWTVEGNVNSPVPGELSYGLSDLVYTSSEIGKAWSANGTLDNLTSVRGFRDASVEAVLSGPLTTNSALTFSWKATGYYTGDYGTGLDTFSAVFTDEDGTQTTIWTLENAQDQMTAQPVSLSLSDFTGRSGSVAIRFSHSGAQFTSGTYGGTIIAPKITAIESAIVPPVSYETVTNIALGVPEILAVETAHGTDMQEGFYRECSREGTVLYVTCSPTVTALRALPSHLTFVPDSAVTVHSLGGGEFAVEIDGSGVTADVDRTRMILTLEAADANGTTVCKDLSLRFSSASGTASEDSWAVEVGGDRVADGSSWTADLPYVWLVRNELAPKGSTAAAFAAAANADTDGDGLANWGEWICATGPTNATEHLRVLLEMTNGVPALDYDPHTLRDGFVPVFVGATNLAPAVWEPADLGGHRFFRVRVERP